MGCAGDFELARLSRKARASHDLQVWLLKKTQSSIRKCYQRGALLGAPPPPWWQYAAREMPSLGLRYSSARHFGNDARGALRGRDRLQAAGTRHDAPSWAGFRPA